MANVMDVLLRMEIPKPEVKEYKIKRLSHLAGEDVVVTLKELTYDRVAEIRETNSQSAEVHVQTILAAQVSPDLKSPELLEKYKAATPAELVKKLYSPGEIDDLYLCIERLSGFRVRCVEEIKKK